MKCERSVVVAVALLLVSCSDTTQPRGDSDFDTRALYGVKVGTTRENATHIMSNEGLIKISYRSSFCDGNSEEEYDVWSDIGSMRGSGIVCVYYKDNKVSHFAYTFDLPMP